MAQAQRRTAPPSFLIQSNYSERLKYQLRIKKYDINATRLIISFTIDNELVEHEVSDLPCPNYMKDTATDSENSTEDFVEYDDQTYRIELYANIYEGNVAIFNDSTEEEIEDFTIKEVFTEE